MKMYTLVFLFLLVYSGQSFSDNTPFIPTHRDYREHYIGFDCGHIKYDIHTYLQDSAMRSPAPSSFYKLKDDFGDKSDKRGKLGFLNFYHGYRINPVFALETGMYFSSPKSIAGKTHTVIKGHYSSLAAFFPVFKNLDVIPSVGLSVVSISTLDLNNGQRFLLKDLAARIMVATDFKLTDSIKLRGSIVWLTTSGTVDGGIMVVNCVMYGIGLNYSL